MLVRRSYVALLAVCAASLTGCCCNPGGGCYPCGPNWCGPQCGRQVWSEWFSLPPVCCDPCNECSQYIGPRLNDDLYSHGNDYHGWCEHRHSRPHYPVSPKAAEPVVAEPAEQAPGETEPATEPYTPGESEPYTLPGPEDDMPSEIPFDTSTGMRRQYGSRMVSYREEPEQRSRPPRYRQSRQYGRPTQYSRPRQYGGPPQYRRTSQYGRPSQGGRSPQRLFEGLSIPRMSSGQVDWGGPSRKLARPPRTRLFSR